MTGVIEALQQLHDGALATATAAHKCDGLARLNLHAHVLQDRHGWPTRIAELDRL